MSIRSQTTLHIVYPTPMVVDPYPGITCIAAEVTTLLYGGSVEIDVFEIDVSAVIN